MKQLPPIPSSLEGLTKNALEIYKIEKLLELKMHWKFTKLKNFWNLK